MVQGLQAPALQSLPAHSFFGSVPLVALTQLVPLLLTSWQSGQEATALQILAPDWVVWQTLCAQSEFSEQVWPTFSLHRLFVQVCVAALQTVAQLPQWLLLLVVLISQPSVSGGVPKLQSANPTLQE